MNTRGLPFCIHGVSKTPPNACPDCRNDATLIGGVEHPEGAIFHDVPDTRIADLTRHEPKAAVRLTSHVQGISNQGVTRFRVARSESGRVALYQDKFEVLLTKASAMALARMLMQAAEQ
jgi:hypothetical protein